MAALIHLTVPGAALIATAARWALSTAALTRLLVDDMGKLPVHREVFVVVAAGGGALEEPSVAAEAAARRADTSEAAAKSMEAAFDAAAEAVAALAGGSGELLVMVFDSDLVQAPGTAGAGAAAGSGSGAGAGASLVRQKFVKLALNVVMQGRQ